MIRRRSAKAALVLAVLLALTAVATRWQVTPPPTPVDQAFEAQQSDVWVEATGRVERLLPDDRDGSRHQRFIVRLESGRTVLIAHNIDLAPRLDRLRPGDHVAFRGEYEWNPKGGVVHWTHHDPSGRHAGGWLEYEGQRYR
ncbi:MAG: DUF3465 domain-containing protein [Gammaproteobacteria bacterium]